MPNSPAKEQAEVVSYDIKIGGQPLQDSFEVLSIDVERSINRIATAKLAFILQLGTGENLTFEQTESSTFEPGAEVEISVGSVDVKSLIFKGIIVNLSVRNHGGGSNEWIVMCSDKAVKMSLGRQSKSFLNMKDSAVISSIVGDYGLSATVDSTDVTHKQLVQYQSNDWDFIMERAEANGLWVYTNDGDLLIKKPLSQGSPELLLDFENDVLSFDFGIDARFQNSSYTCESWDSKAQAAAEGKSAEPDLSEPGNLTGKSLGTKMHPTPEFHRTAAQLDKDELKSWADALLLKSRLSRMCGTVTFFGNTNVHLNKMVELSGFGARFNGQPVVTSIHHEVRAGFWQTTVGFGLPPYWYHEQRTVSASPAGGLLPSVQGLLAGVVLKISDDPDGLYRIKVDAPLLLGGNDGIWTRLIQFYATSGKGSFFLPEVGDEVILGFLNGDPRYPVIIGSVYSEKNKPKYTPDAENKIKAIVTKNELMIEFNDTDKVLTISTPAGNEFTLSDKDKSIKLKDQSGNVVEMKSAGISLSSIQDITLDAKGKISMSAVQDISLSSTGGNVSLKGLNIEAQAQISATVKGTASAELSASGNTMVKGAMVMIN